MDLSIIIVPYKCKDSLDITLQAVFASKTKYSFEVIIIDNDSQDGTIEMINKKYLSDLDIKDKITLFENRNEGFGLANNRGMRMAKGDYVLLLNPDTKLATDNLEIMVNFIASHPEVGIATCKLIRPDGQIDPASRRSEPDPKVSFYRLSGLQKMFPKKFGTYNVLDSDITKSSELDACSGAYMMMSRKAVEMTGGFDPDYFMYGEDLDLCKKVRDAGLKVWYHPKTTCIHYKGKSSGKAPQKSLYAFHDAMWIYYSKHYQAKYSKLMDGFVYTGIWGRYYWLSFVNLFRRKKIVSK